MFEGELEGMFTISYPTGWKSGFVSISIIDEKSGRQFIEASISYEEFTAALSSKYGRPCTFSLHHLDKVGFKREVRSYNFPISSYSENAEDKLKALCSVHEVDGWEADIKGAMSTKQGSNYTLVHFYRYVK